MYKPWSYTTRTLVAIVGAIGVIWLIIVAQPLIQSLIVAGLLAYLLDPVVNLFLRETKLDRLWAARAVYVLFLLLLAGIPAALSTFAFSQFLRLEADFLAAGQEFRQWLAQPWFVLGFQFQPMAVLRNLEQSGGNALATIPTGALGALMSLSTNLLWGLTILVSLYYFLVDGPKIKPWLVDQLSPEYQTDARLLLDEIDDAWRIFIRMQLLIFLILATLSTVSIFLIVWLYRIGLLPLSPVGLTVLLVLVYTLVQQVDNVWLRPYFLGGSLKLHPGVVFISLIGGLALGGVIGVIIAVPLVATIKIIGRYAHCRLLGLPPWPHLDLPPPENEELVPEAIHQEAVLADRNLAPVIRPGPQNKPHS